MSIMIFVIRPRLPLSRMHLARPPQMFVKGQKVVYVPENDAFGRSLNEWRFQGELTVETVEEISEPSVHPQCLTLRNAEGKMVEEGNGSTLPVQVPGILFRPA